MKSNLLFPLSLLIAILASLTATSHAQTRIRVEFESNFSSTGTGFAPLGAVFHDGSFQTFDTNTQLLQSDGLALLAEGGNPATFLAEAAAVSYTHLRAPRDRTRPRMPSSA